MTVCHISSMHDWDDDRIYQRTCLGLARAGHQVHLIATIPEDVPVDRTVRFHWIKARSGWARRWFASKEAIEKAKRVKADIYHFHDPDLLPHIIKIKKAHPRAIIIYDIHENYSGRFIDWGLPGYLGRLFRKYEIAKINELHGYIVVSDSMKSLFSKAKPPGAVIRNNTDISRLKEIDFSSINPFETPTIYTSGTNSHSRNCLQTVQAMKYIGAELEYQVMFVGKYQKGIENELSMQADADGTREKLRMEGMLPWVDNFKRTVRSFCGCVFYKNTLNNQVGIPNRLFEYMYCGIPIVVSDFPELRKIVEATKCGILVNPEDPKSIAKAFEYLLKNPSKAKSMGKNGKRAIEDEYGFHVDLKRLENFYSRLIDR